MDTIGSSVDKLMTVNLKIFHNLANLEKLENLVEQRKGLEQEINNLFMVVWTEDDKNKISRPQHKTY